MSYHILFCMLCAVIAANILVVVIAITKAYRDERIERRFGTFRSGWGPAFAPGLIQRGRVKSSPL